MGHSTSKFYDGAAAPTWTIREPRRRALIPLCFKVSIYCSQGFKSFLHSARVKRNEALGADWGFFAGTSG